MLKPARAATFFRVDSFCPGVEMINSILAKVRRDAPAVAVLLVCMLVTIMASLFEQHHAKERAAMLASADATQFQRTLQQGIDSYLARNHSLAAHFSALDAAPGEADIASFDAYMRSADGLRQNPGMSYIGYIRPNARTEAPTEAVPDPAFTYPYLFIFPHDARARSVSTLDHATFPDR
jgi:CHASE1-domain containing sensor protein